MPFRPPRPITAEENDRASTLLQTIPTFSWGTDVDVHCEQLAHEWSRVGQNLTPAEDSPTIQPYATPEVTILKSHRRALQLYLREDAWNDANDFC